VVGGVITGTSTSVTGTTTAASVVGGVITGSSTSVTGTTTAASVVGGVITGSSVSVTGNVTGGNVTTTGQANLGNIVISGDNITGTNGQVLVNSAGADVDFKVSGDTIANLFIVDAGTDTVLIGTGTPTTNAALKIGTTNSILIPVGNTAQRPSVPATGMIRFNTTTDVLEFYDSDSWTTASSQFTVITADSFTGNGVQTAFTLSTASTTAGTIVAINGVVQIPTTAYSVSSTTLTFTEAPSLNDVIDARVLTTTASVSSLSNGTTSIAIPTANANVAVTVAGSGIVTFTSAGIINNMGNGVGNIGNSTGYFNTVFAKATSAQYADLAEMYEADQIIEAGTVVCFGGVKEVTMCAEDACRKVAGVVSTNPSYLMNSGQTGEYVVPVALQGRVPVRVTGPVQKGDMMVATSNGRARAEADPAVGSVIGKALADFDGQDGVIEVVVGRV
jgi:hypothetical protein